MTTNVRRLASFRSQMIAVLISVVSCVDSKANAADWEWLPDRSHDVDFDAKTEDDATIAFRTTGADPYIVGRWTTDLKADDRVLELEYFCPAGIRQMAAYSGPPFRAKKRADLPDLTIAEGWQRYTVDLVTAFGDQWSRDDRQLRLDFGVRGDVRVRLRNIHIRPRTKAELAALADQARKRQQKKELAKKIAEYQTQQPTTHFSAIEVDEKSIHLSGPDPQRVESWQLIEVPSHESINETGEVVSCIVDFSEGRFHITVPRFFGSRDRLFSGWRLREEHGDFLTARQFATQIKAHGNNYAAARAKPGSQKGLSGISRRGPRQDFVDLGVSAVTLNLVLNRFISFTPGPGRTRIEAPGEPVYFNTPAFTFHDELMDFARRHRIVVSAIVLIPRPKRDSNRHPLVHPECDGGTYAMPDVSSPRGAAIYQCVLKKIAQRYSNTEAAPGGITNWIAHNEVDFHPVWTNMGRQPREVYIESYYRSMRMIHHAARTYNPHARVFASFTHHWNVPADGGWNRLAPRDALESLQRFSQREGEFDWGVAYHPYPQSLFAKFAWQDSNITNDFDTPLITMQNLEVLGRFLDRPSMRTNSGQPRPVLLSEQGYHTDSYTDEAQANQAGSLWYAMRRIAQNPWVESFHYHRWIDHPDEGGLLLGLRTLPTKEHPHGKKKRSWHVYRVIGTDHEAEQTGGLPREH